MDEDTAFVAGYYDRERVQPERERGRQSRNGRRPERRDRPRQPRARVSLVVFTAWEFAHSHTAFSLILSLFGPLCMYTE